MDDVFYFSRSQLSLADIASLGKKRAWPGVRLYEGGLEVDLRPSGKSVSQWAVFELTSLDPTERTRLEGEGLTTGFCISFHPRDTNVLKGILRDVLREFGGWIGSDEEGFSPRFDLSNIEHLVLRPYRIPSFFLAF